MKLTEAELNQKLNTIGLPDYGTYEQKLARLELHSKPVPGKVTEVEADQKALNRITKNAVDAVAKNPPKERMFGKKGKK